LNQNKQRKVDVRFDVGQRVAQRVELLAVMLVSEQVSLDSATWFHHGKLKKESEQPDFTKGGRAEVFRGAQKYIENISNSVLTP